MIKRNVTIGNVPEGDLSIPQGAQAVILFAHGSGNDRHKYANDAIASAFTHRRAAEVKQC
jgi:hypothetical protein